MLHSKIFRGARALAEAAFVRLRRSDDPTVPVNPRRILVFGYMGIGDFILFTPTLRALRELYPNARITLLTGPYSGAHTLAAAVPDIDDVLEIDWANMNDKEKDKLDRSLLREKFDVVVGTYIAPIRFFMWGLRNSPLRIGTVRRIKGPNPLFHPFRWLKWQIDFNLVQEELFRRAFFNKKAVLEVDDTHEIDKGLALVKLLAPQNSPQRAPMIQNKSEEEKKAADYLERFQVKSTDVLVALHPGTSLNQAWKQWPLERYRDLSKAILDKWNVKILLLGTASEHDAMKSAFAGLDRVVPAVSDNALVMYNLIKRSKLLIGGDSGPGHLAILAGTPALRLFGATNSRTFAAWNNTPHKELTVNLPGLPCVAHGLWVPTHSGGQKNYLNLLEVPLVQKEAFELLRQAGAPSRS